MGKELCEMNPKSSIYRKQNWASCDRSHIQRKRNRSEKYSQAIDRTIWAIDRTIHEQWYCSMNSGTVATDTFLIRNGQIFQRYYLRSIALFIAIDRTIHMNSVL